MGKLNSRTKRGVTATSYGLVVGLIAIVSLVAIQSGGSSINSLFTTTAETLETVNSDTVAEATPAEPTPELGPETATVNYAIGSSTCSTVSLVNSGPGGPANINVSVTGDYTQTGCSASNCQGASMGGPASCDINIRGDVSTPGAITGNINITADDGISHTIAVSGTASNAGFMATDASSGFVFQMVQVPQNATIASAHDYHALCQVYGLSAWDTSSTNTSACGGDLIGYPERVGSCNMGNFNTSGYDYIFDEDIPSIGRVWWIAVNHSNQLGLEYNGVGPCNAGEQIGACGTGSVSGSGNGIRHSKNPIYGANYDVRNASLTTTQYMLCAVP